jgi:hypothetical protein
MHTLAPNNVPSERGNIGKVALRPPVPPEDSNNEVFYVDYNQNVREEFSPNLTTTWTLNPNVSLAGQPRRPLCQRQREVHWQPT